MFGFSSLALREKRAVQKKSIFSSFRFISFNRGGLGAQLGACA
jgi:hypothetical protein